jgi:hypothetical protein
MPATGDGASLSLGTALAGGQFTGPGGVGAALTASVQLTEVGVGVGREFLITPIGVELVPIQFFANSSFEFGATPIVINGTFLDQSGGGVGGLFEFGATDIALTGVPIEYGRNFSPFELGVTPITVTRIDADFYAIPPAVLAPSTTGLDLRPTTREFEPPRYPVTFEQSMAGMSEAVLWGNKPGGAKMALGYKAVEDEWAEKWMKLYDDSREVSPLELPSEVYSGLSAGLTNIYNLTKYGLKWFFVGPPKIESVKEGFSAVDVDLEGRNAKTLPYSASGFVAPDAPPPAPVLPPGDPFTPLPDDDVTEVDYGPDPVFELGVKQITVQPVKIIRNAIVNGQPIVRTGSVSTTGVTQVSWPARQLTSSRREFGVCYSLDPETAAGSDNNLFFDRITQVNYRISNDQQAQCGPYIIFMGFTHAGGFTEFHTHELVGAGGKGLMQWSWPDLTFTPTNSGDPTIDAEEVPYTYSSN